MSDSFDESVESKLAVMEGDRVVVQIGLLATLYFPNDNQSRIREAVLNCFDQYREVVGEHLRWSKHPKTFAYHPIDSDKVPAPRAWLADLDDVMAWEFEWRGGEDAESASHFSVKAFSPATWECPLGYFKVALPITWYADNEGDFPSLVVDLCEEISPLHGYGGFGILESPSPTVEHHYEPAVFTLAERFAGLEVDYPVTSLLHLQEGVKGVNWLTVLGERWLGSLGGIDELGRKLGEDFDLHAFSGGVVIQAGPRPQLGNVQTGKRIELYCKAASVLMPVRVREHGSFHHAGEGRFNRQTTEQWLARFD